MTVEGTCDSRFEPLRQAFLESFSTRRETGAALAVSLDSRLVVDLWGGTRSRNPGSPWCEDTIVTVYSVTKAMAALVLLRLADRGAIDLDAPVARVWPEFAAQGKEAITVRQVLSHRAGLPAIRPLIPRESLFDHRLIAAALAAQTPWWSPGSQHGYHALTYGWLVAEIVRRVSRRSVGDLFRNEISRSLDADFHIGLGKEDHLRVAELRGSPPPAAGERNFAVELMSHPDSLAARAFLNPALVIDPHLTISEEWKVAELPAVNGHGNARALAMIYGALACRNPQLLSSAMIDEACTEHAVGNDLVLNEPTRFGLGFMLSHPGAPFGPTDNMGHPGAGGSMGFADLNRHVGFGYTTNRLGQAILVDSRVHHLIEVLYACL